jgi:thiosulfate/3-mercaptopyruvate sulfurtransferase
MKKLFIKLVVLTTLASVSFALGIPKNHIVSTNWLQKNIEQKNIVIIDTRGPKAYGKSHIKNALNLPKKVWFEGKIGNIPKLYDTPKQIEKMFKKAGITNNSIIVFYSAGIKNKDFADAASGVWSAYLYGMKKGVILNGGFAKWIEEKKVVTKIVPNPKPSDFEVEKFDNNIVASLNDIIHAIYDENIQITDARVSKFYTGADKRKDLARHGRIPTAKLTPVIREVKKVGKHFEFLSEKESKKVLHNAGYGIDLKKPLIIYCNTGHKARGLWFVSKFIDGMKNVKVYDGSMVEYSRTLLPMENGESLD